MAPTKHLGRNSRLPRVAHSHQGNRSHAAVAGVFAHLRNPLYRNGYALILSAVASSGLGVLYWALAARYYAPAQVGVSSALVAAMMLLAGITVVGLPGILVRFVGTFGPQTRSFIVRSYLLTIVVTLVSGPLFCYIIGTWMPELRFLATDYRVAAIFVLATAAWCIFSLQDSVLTGLRQASWIPLENIIFALVKIVFLVSLAALMPTWGIFAAWTVPMLISLLPVNLLIFAWVVPRHHRVLQQAEHVNKYTGATRAMLWRYFIGNYPASLLYLGYTTVLPLLVTHMAGPQANAYFYMPWMIASGLQMIALSMSMSLTVEAAHNAEDLGNYCYRTLLQILRLLLPIAILLLITAPLLLQIFGADYAREGTILLRLLVLSTIPNTIVALYLSLVRVRNQVGGVLLAQGLLCICLLGISYLLLPNYGISGVGWAALIGQSGVALFTLSTNLRPLLRQAYRATRIAATQPV